MQFSRDQRPRTRKRLSNDDVAEKKVNRGGDPLLVTSSDVNVMKAGSPVKSGERKDGAVKTEEVKPEEVENKEVKTEEAKTEEVNNSEEIKNAEAKNGEANNSENVKEMNGGKSEEIKQGEEINNGEEGKNEEEVKNVNGGEETKTEEEVKTEAAQNGEEINNGEVVEEINHLKAANYYGDDDAEPLEGGNLNNDATKHHDDVSDASCNGDVNDDTRTAKMANGVIVEKDVHTVSSSDDEAKELLRSKDINRADSEIDAIRDTTVDS